MNHRYGERWQIPCVQNVANGESELQRRPRGVTNDTRWDCIAVQQQYRVRTSR